MLTKKSKSLLVPQFALGILIITLLYPYLLTGYYFDDSLNSNLPGALLLRQQSALNFLLSGWRDWIIGTARLIPLGTATALTFYFIQSLFVYRLFQVALTGLNILLFLRWLQIQSTHVWF